MEKTYSERKNKEINKAIFALQCLFSSLIEDPTQVMVGRLTNREVITVSIRGGCYDINVECENEKQMVKSVVDAVILKL